MLAKEYKNCIFLKHYIKICINSQVDEKKQKLEKIPPARVFPCRNFHCCISSDFLSIPPILNKGTVSRDCWPFFMKKDSTWIPYSINRHKWFREPFLFRKDSHEFACPCSHWLCGHMCRCSRWLCGLGVCVVINFADLVSAKSI